MAAKAASAITVAPENGADRKNRMSISGSRRCSSVTATPMAASRAAAKQPMMSGEPQPCRGPSMSRP